MVALDAEDNRQLERIRHWPGVVGLRLDPSGARVEIDDLDRVPELVSSLVAEGIRLTKVQPHRPTLEDLYFLIRRQLSQGARSQGREVDSVLDPVSTGRLAPSAGMGPGSSTADLMPTMVVPDSLDAESLDAFGPRQQTPEPEGPNR